MDVNPMQHAAANPAAPPAGAAAPAAGMVRRGVLYPNHYTWFVFLAALDVLCTYLILTPGLFASSDGRRELVGQELNALADWVIHTFDTPGKVAYKFALVALVVVICEVVGRRKPAVGRKLAEWAVALTAIPVAVALAQMLDATVNG